jgi:hypothetical protein
MRRTLLTIGLLVVGFVALALGLDAIVGMRQPVLDTGGREGILRTFDQSGSVFETRLHVFDDHGTLWIQSGHHFRGWYYRLLRNPEVELVRSGEVHAYHAVALDTPEAKAHLEQIIRQHAGTLRFYALRTLLLFADVKPVRLDPR